MAVSASGLGMLLFLILIGPFYYLCRYLYKHFLRHEKIHSNVHKGDDGREEMGTSSYIFALVGYAIGIGNVWRFPYVIATNGGSAALIAYLICLVLVSAPLFLYEMILGQYTRTSFINTWQKIRPRWLSFGWAQYFLIFVVQTYYSMIVAYTLPYIAGSCIDPLPWTDNTTSQEYWTDTILNSYESYDEKPPGPGPIQWRLATALFVFWCMTFVSIAFGKNLLAQITYVTVTMPVVLILILLITTTQLTGAIDGIKFYIGKFEASELANLKVWATALGQILFSLSPGMGTALTYSSYVNPKEDVFRAGVIVATSNSAFSIIGGFAIFAMVGHLAYEEGLPVEEVATKGGMGLAFIIISEAMTLFGQYQNVMSVLFFVMLLTLGLDSAYAWTETIVSATEELLEKRGIKRPLWQTSLVLCTIMFLIGLIFTTRMGFEILDTIDMFVGTIFLLLICGIEAIILNVDVGWKRLAYALKAATIGNKSSPHGRSIFPTWLCRMDFHFFVPVGTSFLAIYQIVNVAKNQYGGYPMSIVGWGWALLSICIALILGTIWKCDPSTLPPLEEDPVFKPLFDSMEDQDKTVEAANEYDQEKGQESPDGSTDEELIHM